MPSYTFYPSIGQLISIGSLPEGLENVLENLLSQVFDDYYYKDYQFSKSPSGHEGTHQLIVLSYKKMSVGLGEVDLIDLNVNPSFSNGTAPSEIPVTAYYRWELLKYAGKLDLDDFLKDWSKIFELIVDIAGQEDDEILQEVLNVFHSGSTNALLDFVTDFNSEYPGSTAFPNSTNLTSPPLSVSDVLDELESSLQPSIETIVFEQYLLADSLEDTLGNISELCTSLLENFGFESIEELIYPYVSVEIGITSLALDFPRWLLKPVSSGSIVQDPNVQSSAIFDVSGFRFDSIKGFTYESIIFSSFTESAILNTGLIFSLSGLSVDLRNDQNIPEANDDGRPDNFKGIYASQASLTFPDNWNVVSGSLVVDDVLIGTEGGLSGVVSISNTPLTTSFFGAEVEFDHFDLIVSQSNITEATIDGTLKLPGLKDLANPSNDASIDFDITFYQGAYRVTCSNFPDISVFGIELYLQSLSFSIYEDKLLLLAGAGDIRIPGFEDGSNNPVDISVAMSYDFDNDLFSFSGSNFPAVNLLDFADLTINSLSMEYDGSSVNSFSLDGTLEIEYFKDQAGTTTLPINVSMDYDGTDFSISGNGTVYLFGNELVINTISGTFSNGSMTNLSFDCDLKIDQLKDTGGNPKDIGITISYVSASNYSVSIQSNALNIDFFGMNMKIEEVNGTFGSSGIDFDVKGVLEIDDVNESGNTSPAEIEFIFDWVTTGYAPTYAISLDTTNTSIVSVEIFGVEVSITALSGTFTNSGLQSFGLGAEVLIDQMKDTGSGTTTEPIYVAFSYGYDTLAAIGTYTGVLSTGTTTNDIDLGGLVLSISSVSFVFDTDQGFQAFGIAGSLAHDAFVDNNDDPFYPTFSIDYSQPSYTLTIGNIVTYIKSVQVDLTSISGTFTNTTINAFSGSGTLTLDNVAGDTIDIEISIAGKDDFYVKVDYPTPGFNLSIPNLVDFTLREFTIGREKPSGTAYWFVHIGNPGNTNQSLDEEIALDANITLSIPVIDKFIPERIGINNMKLMVDSGVTVEQPMFFVTWEALDGLDISGSPSGFDITIPLNLSIFGAVNVSSARLKYDSSADEVKVLMSGSVILGPLVGSVKDIGIKFTLEESGSGGGNLGPVNIGDYSLSPPTGLGMSLDAVVFKGGGYLQFEDGEYAGVMQVSIVDIVTVTAIGIISTKNLPGDIKFSLIIIISAEFQPIQLGFGFTLNGAGGLLGLHRTMNVDFLAEGVKTGALESILFPENPVENAVQIINDIGSAFPIKPDQFVFGPMAIIGWGTPSLITVDFGLIIEVPNPFTIAILGVVRMVLPDEKLAVLKLQVNFIGVLSFDQKFMWLRASLFDSTIQGLVISGDMAFVMGWGSNPVFVITAGGFHPQFEPPTGYTALEGLDRMRITIIDEQTPVLDIRMIIDAYFAVTSNTVQFGALIDFYAKVAVGKGEADMKFNTMFVFSPFSFISELTASLSVSVVGIDLIKADMEFSLTGPGPYNVDGYARFKVLGVKKKFEVAKTWGDADDTVYETINVENLVIADLQKLGNWASQVDPVAGRQVTIRKVADLEDEVVIDPEGDLVIRQKVVPLGVTIEKLGNRYAVSAQSYTISAEVSGVSSYTSAVKDYYAPASFKDVSDNDKLSGQSFELFDTGITVRPGGASNREYGDYAVYRMIQYEDIRIDINDSLYGGLQAFPAQTSHTPMTYDNGNSATNTAFESGLLGNAVATSDVARRRNMAGTGHFASQRVTVSQQGFVVANLSDLSAHDGNSLMGTRTQAEDYMRSLIDANPGLEDQLLVVDEFSYNN